MGDNEQSAYELVVEAGGPEEFRVPNSQTIALELNQLRHECAICGEATPIGKISVFGDSGYLIGTWGPFCPEHLAARLNGDPSDMTSILGVKK